MTTKIVIPDNHFPFLIPRKANFDTSAQSHRCWNSGSDEPPQQAHRAAKNWWGHLSVRGDLSIREDACLSGHPSVRGDSCLCLSGRKCPRCWAVSLADRFKIVNVLRLFPAGQRAGPVFLSTDEKSCEADGCLEGLVCLWSGPMEHTNKLLFFTFKNQQTAM